jgi:hypothetical protein
VTPLEELVLPSGQPVPIGNWSPVSQPSQYMSRPILLTDGRVLALGADGQQWFTLSPDSAGNFSDGTWTAAAPMSVWRTYFPSNVLPDGRVLVLGGESSGDTPIGAYTGSGETYDPVSNTWSPIDYFPGPPNTNPLGQIVYEPGPAPTELVRAGSANKVLSGSFWGPQTFLFDPTSTTGQQWGGLTYKSQVDGNDASGEEGSVLLPDGSVLTYDLTRSNPGIHPDGFFKAERYFPSANQWADASHLDATNPPQYGLGLYRDEHNQPISEIGPPMLLPPDGDHPDGLVLFLGANGHTALYDPAGTTTTTVGGTSVTEYGTWYANPGGDLPTGDGGDEDTVVELANGNVLLGPEISQGNVGEYSYAQKAFIQQPTNSGPTSKADIGGLLDLPNGHVLMVTDGQVWDFDPGILPANQNPDWRPIEASRPEIHDPPIQIGPRGTYELLGYGLTGVSEGSTEGDDAENSSNYPIVKLTLGANAWYVKTHDWTPGVQESLSSVLFDVPPTLSPGADYTLTVIANGIESHAIDFKPDYGVVYADSSWQNLSDGTQIQDADPVLPGDQGAVIGTNAFASVNAAITAANDGGWVIVNGANGGSTSGVFHEQVAVNSNVGLYLQNGSVTFDTLSGNDPDAELDLNAPLTVGDNVTSTAFAGSIVGPGSLTKVGMYDELTLSGPVSNAGGVFIEGGFVQPAAPGVLAGTTVKVDYPNGLDLSGLTAATVGALAGGVNGSVTLGTSTQTLTAGGLGVPTTFAGPISGTGSFVKVGAGAMTFTGTGTTARVTVNGGSVKLEPVSPSALAFSTVTVNADGGLDLSAVSSATIGGLAGSGAISLPGDLIVGTDGDSTTYSGALYGNGSLSKSGTGSLTLTGSDETDAGATVSSGTLLVDSPGVLTVRNPATVTVAAGAAIRGTGAILAAVTNVAGSFGAGTFATDGTLTATGLLVASSLSFASGGVFTAQLNGSVGTTSYDQVAGFLTATLTGATLHLTLAPGYVPNAGDQFTLLYTASGPIVGRFANLANNGDLLTADGRYFTVAYAPHSVTLTALPPVGSIQVNDGSAQRSEVRSITVTFNGPVSFAGGNGSAAAAFELDHLGDPTDGTFGTPRAVTLSAAVSSNGAGQTVVTLMFSGSETDSFSAQNGAAASLADGRYRLTIFSANVSLPDGSHLSGGTNYVSPTDAFGVAGLHLYRLFGDGNGDGVVDSTDFAFFRSTWDLNWTDADFLAYFDSDNSGAIDSTDLGQLRTRFNSNVFA